MKNHPFKIFGRYLKSRSSLEYARRKNAPGIGFAEYGVHLGLQLLLRGQKSGLGYWLAPVSITRYYEFPFVLSCLPDNAVHALDLSSPRLFGFYAAQKGLVQNIRMINPDADDIGLTKRMIETLGIRNVEPVKCDLAGIERFSGLYDCIWAISVMEHIHGGYDDTFAVRVLYQHLKPGGRLIVTVPADRCHREEYRKSKCYETQEANAQGEYFFQRWYDKTSLEERLFAPIAAKPKVLKWFGETVPGRFENYIADWLERGLDCTVCDPGEIADYYREFNGWEDMPGTGLAAFMIEKPLDSSPDTVG